MKKRIPTSHYVHIGSVLGSYEWELNEDPREKIRNLGNWGLSVQETRYSTKFPLGIIRSKAHLKKNINHNPIIGLPTLHGLCGAFPPWLKKAKANFDANTANNTTCTTARCFILFMSDLAEVVIQDTAAVAVKFPDQMAHPIYHEIKIFRTDDFNKI